VSSSGRTGKEHGFVEPVPLPPVAPEPGDCCGEGCAHCVLDLYDEALERHQADLAAWKSRQITAAHDLSGTGRAGA